MVRIVEGDVLNEVVLFEILWDSLDLASQYKLQARRESDHHLTFEAFWRELDRDFGGDSSLRSREEWESVSLRGVYPLTRTEWRKFTAAFEATMVRVEDRTEGEVERRILWELPSELRVGLQDAILQKQERQFWVRFRDPLGATPEELRDLVADVVGRGDVRVEATKSGYLCDCVTEEARETVVAMEGWLVGGAPCA